MRIILQESLKKQKEIMLDGTGEQIYEDVGILLLGKNINYTTTKKNVLLLRTEKHPEYNPLISAILLQ